MVCKWINRAESKRAPLHVKKRAKKQVRRGAYRVSAACQKGHHAECSMLNCTCGCPNHKAWR